MLEGANDGAGATGLGVERARLEDIGAAIVNEAIEIHRDLGAGLLESVYETVLSRTLEQKGFRVDRQRKVSLVYRDLEFDEAFRADLVVEDSIIVEIKSIKAFTNAHRKQLLTYLKLADMRLGFLLNFGAALMKNGIVRTVNALPE